MGHDPRIDIRDYFILTLIAFLFGIFNFSWDWWIFVKVPLLGSSLVLIHALGLYMIRRNRD